MRNAFRGLAVGVVALGALAITVPSYAGSYNGVCEKDGGGEACLYNGNGGTTGALYDTLYSKPDYDGSTFYGTSTAIANNIGGLKNLDPDNSLKIFTGRNYTGTVYVAVPNSGAGFSNRSWESHCFTSNSACP